jgi:hypothetical protein
MNLQNEEGAEPSLAEERAPQRTLWILACWSGDYHQLIPLYALSEEDANELAEKHIRETDTRLTRINLQAFPDGFVIHRSRLPGKVKSV